MDPGRIHAYLQAACAGLGFDIGEVWFSSNESGTSTVAKIESRRHSNDIKFLQLYTSRSYKNRRNDLLRPTSEDSSNKKNNATSNDGEITKHVLSPKLVNAIADTAQVVWANCQEREGLLGRSDMRLQTAVGMPVAMDSDGNMCIVVMFSPNNVQSNKNAVEYLKFLSEGATSTSIPCLLPVVDSNTKKLEYSPKRFSDWQEHEHDAEKKKSSTEQNAKKNIFQIDDLSNDFFGIPMLPPFAELDVPKIRCDASSASGSDDGAAANAFDQVSYGLWSTIMENPEISTIVETIPDQTTSTAATMVPLTQQETPLLHPERKARLEEFSDAFLAMSVFDIADFWVPSSSDGSSQYLHHVFSLSSDDENTSLNYFESASIKQVVRGWSGAVGRAFCSGNAVWSTNTETIVDMGRTEAFAIANIKTALAIPIFSSGSVSPSCVLCLYSMVRSDCVPFVLKFVEQALRSLWHGLESLQPHENIGKDLWKDVAPADLGEMAADLEMQKAFYKKKRPFDAISSKHENRQESLIESDSLGRHKYGRSSSLSLQLQALPPPSGEISTSLNASLQSNSIPNGRFMPVQKMINKPRQFRGIQEPAQVIQNHLQEAVKSVADAKHVRQYQSSTLANSATVNVPSQSPQALISQPSRKAPQTYIPQPSNQSPQIYIPQPSNQSPQTYIPQPSNQSPQTYIPQPPNQSPQTRILQPPNQSPQTHILQPPNQSPHPYISQPPNQFQQQHTGNAQDRQLQDYGSAFSQRVQHQTTQCLPTNAPTSLLINVSPSHIPSGTHQNSIINQVQPLHQPQLQTPPQLQPQFLPQATVSSDFQAITSGNNLANASTSSILPSTTIPLCTTISKPDTTNFSRQKGKHVKLVCRIQGCEKMSAPRRPYCTKHSGNRICEHLDCTKCAQGATRFCIGHGGGRRCTYAGCDKGARDKFFCAAHGGGKRCKEPGCKKSAVGGSNLCTSHGGGRRCAIDGCEKSAQSSTKFCVKHGGGKKCANPTCEKVARGRTRFCAGHGGGVRCKLEGCTRIAIGKLQLCRAHGGGSSTAS